VETADEPKTRDAGSIDYEQLQGRLRVVADDNKVQAVAQQLGAIEPNAQEFLEIERPDAGILWIWSR